MNYLERLEDFYDKNVDEIKLYIDKYDPDYEYSYGLYLKGPDLPLCGYIDWEAQRELTPQENKEAFMKSVKENITSDLRWVKR